MAAPYYIVFAGVNGAGKSTLFRTGLWQNGSFPPDMPRVNPDEIIAAHGWNWKSSADQLKAGKEAVRRIRHYLENSASFNQETTLSGRMSVRTIVQARRNGFRIVLFYVGLDNPAIANTRIAHRGETGGHLIDPDAVERRYRSSLAHLVEVLDICDEAYLYDNTVTLQLAAAFTHGELFYIDPPRLDDGWVAPVLTSLGYQEVPWHVEK